MGKRRIFTVGFQLPGDEFEYVRFDSNQTLLDADIILFEPTLKRNTNVVFADNKPILPVSSVKQVHHWRQEMIEAPDAGKLVIVYLTQPLDWYRFTDQTGPSDTSGVAHTITKISSYEAVPFLEIVRSKSDKNIRLEKDATYLRPYWTDFSGYSQYEVEIVGDFTRVLLKSRAGNKTVGAAIHSSNGAILFLPPLKHKNNNLFSYSSKTGRNDWAEEGFQFGKRLVATLANLAKNLRKSVQSIPPQSWTLD